MFSPAAEEIAYSQRLVEAFEEAQSRGLGSVSFEGKMIDIMSYKQASELVSLVETIAEKEKKRQLSSSASLSPFFTSSLSR